MASALSRKFSGRRACTRAARPFVAALALAAALAMAAPVAGQPPAADTNADGYSLVARAMQARRTLVYEARQDVVWTTSPSGASIVQIVTDVSQNRSRSRLIYRFPPDAAGRVMIDDGIHATLYDPAGHVVLNSHTMAEDEALLPTLLSLLRRNYSCLRLRREPVNGCLCDVIALRPRFQPGPYKLCWIDSDSHMILRTEEYDDTGSRRYVSSYETIRFLPRLPASELSLPPGAKTAQHQDVAAQSVPTRGAMQAFTAAGIAGGRLPAWLPRGYALLHCTVVHRTPDHPMVILRYGDGVETLVVAEDAPKPGQEESAYALRRRFAQLGQQIWIRRDGKLRSVVHADVALSDSVGADMIASLDPHASARLAQAMVHDFGAPAAGLATALRKQGWSYQEIAALCLGQHAHPQAQARAMAQIHSGGSWPQVAPVFGADAPRLEDRSRAWVTATLASAAPSGAH